MWSRRPTYAGAAIVGVVVVLVLALAVVHGSGHVVRVVDGVAYRVRRGADADETAARLHALRGDLGRVVDHLHAHALPDAQAAARLKARFGAVAFGETRSTDRDVGYALDKRAVRVCVRDRGALQPRDTTLLVLLHELAHIMTESAGHTAEFRRNMRALVQAARDVGVLREFPATYHCGEYVRLDATSSLLLFG